SGGKGNGKIVPTISTSLEQRSTAKHTSPVVSTPSPSYGTNSGVSLDTVHIPSISSSL
ncbi:hypothetical protein A2U01_0089961, partial [Trifolium medium]|nr:hypothetical protein [Trifolium medium]